MEPVVLAILGPKNAVLGLFLAILTCSQARDPVFDFCVRSVIFVCFDNFIAVDVMCAKKGIFGVY